MHGCNGEATKKTAACCSCCQINSLPLLLSRSNICHGSDSVESAEKEIALWFGKDVVDYALAGEPWVYE